jgi:hypothetical protein
VLSLSEADKIMVATDLSRCCVVFAVVHPTVNGCVVQLLQWNLFLYFSRFLMGGLFTYPNEVEQTLFIALNS